MRARTLLLVVAVILSTSVLPAAPAAGGTGEEAESDPLVDFALSPSRLEYELAPGAGATETLELFNHTGRPLLLDAYVRDIEIAPSDLVGGDDLAFSASRWITIGRSPLVVPAESSVKVPLVVDVPSDAVPGGFHAFAYFETVSRNRPGTVAPEARLGATVLVDVAPPGVELDRAARVADMQVRVHWDGLLRPTLETDTTVENLGATHVVTGGVHTYRSWPGGGNRRVKVGPWTLLRGTRHTLRSTWSGVPLLGRVTVTSELVFQRGPDDLPVIVAQRSVWIVPWRLFGVVAAALAVVAGAVVAGRRSRRARRRPLIVRADLKGTLP